MPASPSYRRAATIEEVRALLGAARRPLILYGGCDWGEAGREALHDFAMAPDIPVLASFRWQDRLDNVCRSTPAMRSATGALLELTVSPEAITPRRTLSGIREAALAGS